MAERLDPTPLILIVDDEHDTRQLMRLGMELEGYAVEEAANGEQALATYERVRPDIILLDVMMPVLGGFAVCERIRTAYDDDTTPVVMFTALSDRDSIDRAHAAGATDFIPKDAGLAALRERVKTLLCIPA